MPTISNDLADYLNEKKATLGEDSYKVYRLFGEKFGKWLSDNGLNDLATNRLTPVQCNNYRAFILKLHSHPTTRNKEINQLKIFCNYYTELTHQRFKVSPAAPLKFVGKVESEMHEPYTDEQAAAIIGEILEREDYYLLLFIYLIYYAFTRPGKEARLLKVKDFKTHNIIIRSARSKTKRLKGPTITKAIEELVTHLGVRNYDPNFYVFGSEGVPGVEPVGKGCFYHRHRQILIKLGIAKQGKYTIYGWKHSGNIRGLLLGISERSLIEQNGFADKRTFDIYVRRLSAYHNSELYEKFI